MVTFYMVAIASLSAGTLAYLLGASKEWENHRVTIANYQRLAMYSNEVTLELSALRTASERNAMGSGHPSPARRSHLELVK